MRPVEPQQVPEIGDDWITKHSGLAPLLLYNIRTRFASLCLRANHSSAHNYARPRAIDCLGVRPLYRTETSPRALAASRRVLTYGNLPVCSFQTMLLK
jgi:hypothetical protein